jgi:hypothetical protein
MLVTGWLQASQVTPQSAPPPLLVWLEENWTVQGHSWLVALGLEMPSLLEERLAVGYKSGRRCSLMFQGAENQAEEWGGRSYGCLIPQSGFSGATFLGLGIYVAQW